MGAEPREGSGGPGRYRDWLEGFEREVTDAMRESPPGEAALGAVSDFEDWWRTENPPTEDPSFPVQDIPPLSRELEIAHKELRTLNVELEALRASPDLQRLAQVQAELERLGAERAELAAKAERIETENRDLRSYRATIEAQVSELRVKMSRIQDEYESQVLRLEDQISHLNEKAMGLDENKRFLQTQFGRQSDRLARAEAELRSAIEANRAIEKERDELAAKAEDLRSRLDDKTTDRAALEASIAELRRHAADLQERLVRSRESLDSESASREQSQRELAFRNQQLEERLTSQQRQAEEKIREATAYLESQVREIKDETKMGQAHLGDLLKALNRLREGLP